MKNQALPEFKTIASDLDDEFDNVVDDICNDLQNAIYMLHYVNDDFEKEEIRDVCCSLKILSEYLQADKNTKE